MLNKLTTCPQCKRICLTSEMNEVARGGGHEFLCNSCIGLTDAAVPKDPINPSHYRRHPSGVECIRITQHENYCIGNAIKYLWRHREKGKPIEDLKKAVWYIQQEIVKLEKASSKKEPTLREAEDQIKKYSPQDIGPGSIGIQKF